MENFNEVKLWLSPNPLLAKSWSMLMLVGIFYAAVGTATLIWSQSVFNFFILLVGALCIVFGAAMLYSGLKSEKSFWPVCRAAIIMAAGVFITAAPLFFGKAVGYVIGIWIILSAIDQILSAVTAPQESTGKMPMTVSGIVSIFFGAAVMIWPAIMAQLFGAYMLLHGIFTIACANGIREVLLFRQKQQEEE